MGWPCPGSLFPVDSTTSMPLVARGLIGPRSAAVLTTAGALLLWAWVGCGVPVLFMTLVTAAVSKALWELEEVGGLEVTPGGAMGLEERLAGKEGCRGVVEASKKP